MTTKYYLQQKERKIEYEGRMMRILRCSLNNRNCITVYLSKQAPIVEYRFFFYRDERIPVFVSISSTYLLSYQSNKDILHFLSLPKQSQRKPSESIKRILFNFYILKGGEQGIHFHLKR